VHCLHVKQTDFALAERGAASSVEFACSIFQVQGLEASDHRRARRTAACPKKEMALGTTPAWVDLKDAPGVHTDATDGNVWRIRGADEPKIRSGSQTRMQWAKASSREASDGAAQLGHEADVAPDLKFCRDVAQITTEFEGVRRKLLCVKKKKLPVQLILDGRLRKRPRQDKGYDVGKFRGAIEKRYRQCGVLSEWWVAKGQAEHRARAAVVENLRNDALTKKVPS